MFYVQFAGMATGGLGKGPLLKTLGRDELCRIRRCLFQKCKIPSNMGHFTFTQPGLLNLGVLPKDNYHKTFWFDCFEKSFLRLGRLCFAGVRQVVACALSFSCVDFCPVHLEHSPFFTGSLRVQGPLLAVSGYNRGRL